MLEKMKEIIAEQLNTDAAAITAANTAGSAASVYDAAGLPVYCDVCEQSAGYVRPAVGLRLAAKCRGQAGQGLCAGQSSDAHARRTAL